MSVKINSVSGPILLLALLLALAGCTPAGPRALLEGKKYLDRGDYANAVTELKTATGLLATNAAAWNYYGVALQRAGQPDAAANAYNRALELDRDLIEARLNLGSALLDQNKPDAAKAEFVAYTLRRPNDAVGWLKLGSAQLKLGEIVPAERSFSTVLGLKSSDAEAYNGLGLARIQRGRPRDAAQFFTAAVQARPDYAAALLNLATVSHQYLHDNQTALKNYRAYLALSPRLANWDEVNAIADSLARTPPPEPSTANAKPGTTAILVAESKPETKNPIATAVHPAQPPHSPTIHSNRVEPVAKPSGTPSVVVQADRPIVGGISVTTPTPPMQVVQVSPAPTIQTAPRASPPASEPAGDLLVPEPPPKPGFWHRLFGASGRSNAGGSKYTGNLTPLPGSESSLVATTEKTTAPVAITPPAPVDFPRYNYLSPSRPHAGDRRAASGAFTQARLAEQEEKWQLALAGYRQAVELDPSWFEAQYNAGVIAHRLRNYDSALASYEVALAIEPESVDTRYNFALALKAAGFAPDAANELKKILAAHPTEVRAHLALANLCAQSLHDPAQARRHYLKVLELDPNNPQAADIHFWLAANPGG